MPRLADLENDVHRRLCENGSSSLSVEVYADLSRIMENGKSGEYGKCSLTFLSFLMKIYPSQKLTEIVPHVPRRMTVSCRKISECLRHIKNWESGGRIHLEFPVTGSKKDKIECLVMWDLLMVTYGPLVHNLDGASSEHDLAVQLRKKWSRLDEDELKRGFDSLTNDKNMNALNENTSMNREVLYSELAWVEKLKNEVEKVLESQETVGQARSGDQSGWEETSKEQSAREVEACPHPNVQLAAAGPQTWTGPVDVPRREETLGYKSESKSCKDDNISCPDASADVPILEMLVSSTVDLEEALQKERESSRLLKEALSKEETDLREQREEFRSLQEKLQNQQYQAGEDMRRKQEEIQHLLEENKDLVSKSGEASREHLSVSNVLDETARKFQLLIAAMRQYLAQEEPYIRQKSEHALFDSNEASGDEIDDRDGGEPRQDDDTRYFIEFFEVIENKDGLYRENIRQLQGIIDKCALEKRDLKTRSNDLELSQQQQFQRIEDQEREAHGLAREKADLQSHVETLEKKLQEQTVLRDENLKIIENTKNELSSLQEASTKLQQEHKSAIQRTAEEIEEQLGQMKTEIGGLKAENGRLRSEKEAMSVQLECRGRIIANFENSEHEHKAEIQNLNNVNKENHAVQERLLQSQAEAVQKRSEECENSEQERRKLNHEMESLQRKLNELEQNKDALERENCKLSEQVQNLSYGASHLKTKIIRGHWKTIKDLRYQSKQSETARKDHATGIERKEQRHQTGSESSTLALLRLTRIFLHHGDGPLPCHVISCEVCQCPSLLDSCGRLLDAEGIMELLRASGVLSSAESSGSVFYPSDPDYTFHPRVQELMLQVNTQMAKNQVLLSDGPETNAFITILQTIGTLFSRALETERRFMETKQIYAQSIEQSAKEKEECERKYAVLRQRLSQEMEQVELNKSEIARLKNDASLLKQEKGCIGLDLEETEERLMEINRRYKKLKQDSDARIRELELEFEYGEEAFRSLQDRLNTEIDLKKRLSEQRKKFEQDCQSQAGGLSPFTESEHARKLQQSRLALMRLIRLMCYNGKGLMPCLIRGCMECLSSGPLKDPSHHPNERQLLDLLEENGFQRSYMYAMLTSYSNPPENAKGLHPQVLDLMKLALGELDQSRQDGDAGPIIPEAVCFKTLVQGIVALRSDPEPYILGKQLLKEREDKVTERESMIATKDAEHQQKAQIICKLESDVQQRNDRINNLLTERAHHEKSLKDLKNKLQSKEAAEVDSQREMVRDLQERMLCSKLALLELIRIFLLYSDEGSLTACCIENCLVCQRPVYESDFSHPPSKARVSSLLEESGLLHGTSPPVNSDPSLDSCYDDLRANALEQTRNSPRCSPEAKHFVSLLSTIDLKVRDQRSRKRELEERNLEVQGLREEKEKQLGTTNHSSQREALRDVFTLLISGRNSGLAYNHDVVDGLLQKAGLKCSSVVRALCATPVGDALSADINLPETTDLYLEYKPLFQYLEILHGKIITTPRLFKGRTSSLGHSPKSTPLSLDGRPVRQSASESPRAHDPKDASAKISVPVDPSMASSDHTEAQPKNPQSAYAIDENGIGPCDGDLQVDEDWSGWPTGGGESSPKGEFLSEEARHKPQVTAPQMELEALQDQRANQENSVHQIIAAQGPNYPANRMLWPARDHTNPVNKTVVKRHIPLPSLFAMEDIEEAKSNATNVYSYYTSKGYNKIPDCGKAKPRGNNGGF
ncbi:hypothetical protein B0J13DRAFT_653709 [Dactylonectria estremocensis]|uniref:Uncharacterized protein n=1 Tax=Dactylonectria estremocensis TaxID=1079267 RepID=A0A9P9DB81_9HYPO|nr:hypothetical protein B0J13DRAFT_653709 [Dactylonectria estremocensis]